MVNTMLQLQTPDFSSMEVVLTWLCAKSITRSSVRIIEPDFESDLYNEAGCYRGVIMTTEQRAIIEPILAYKFGLMVG